LEGGVGEKIFMKRSVIYLVILYAVLSFTTCEASAFSQSDIYLSSQALHQGDLILVRITVKDRETPQMIWMNREIYLAPNRQKTVWDGFLAADLTAKPGRYRALLKKNPSGHEKQLVIEVLKKDYGVRRLNLPKDMVELSAENLRRVKKESKLMGTLWEAPPSAPLWNDPFLRPISGRVMTPFGPRSVINDQPRAPHSGVDLKAKKGTPIRATNDGRVALTCDYFFSGRSVVIDHGGGIQSMYFHLERILVQQDEMVTKGHIIGLVGSSGRATGPHLHWGIRINGARVDPLRLLSVSKRLRK
jgi:murein DD-endopeptidase MepM/ murein hydrolase activator NlpD